MGQQLNCSSKLNLIKVGAMKIKHVSYNDNGSVVLARLFKEPISLHAKPYRTFAKLRVWLC
jgi:hypothetical protein